MHLKKSVEEAKKEVDRANMELEKMQTLMNKTHNDAEELELEMENMTSSHIGDIENQQICSQEEFVTECCQVKLLYSWEMFTVASTI